MSSEPSHPGLVGYLINDCKGSVVWEPPRAFTRKDTLRGQCSKSVLHCPAVRDFEGAFYEVSCPYDLRLKARLSDKSPTGIVLAETSGQRRSVSPKALREIVCCMAPDRWRSAKKPLLQIATPYRFVADAPIELEQFPPFLRYTGWPGVVVGGKFPTHVWPRTLSWAFEWHDLDRELVLKRGAPWFLCRFSPAAERIELVRASWNPEVKKYTDSIDGVVNVVSNTFALFETANRRRPERLLFTSVRDDSDRKQ